MIKNLNLLAIFIYLLFGGAYGCKKSSIDVQLFKDKKQKSLSITNIKIINHQVVITGSGFSNIQSLKIKEGTNENVLNIESKTNSTITANTLSNVTFAAGKIFDFIFASANAASTFTIDFSLCDSNLGGKGFNCAITPNDKEVLSYDAVSGKWRPRAINGLSYLGVWSAAGGSAPTIQPSGSYYVISAAGTIGAVSFDVGDWIVSNGTVYQKIDNSQAIISVFGRTGAVTANLDDFSDVVITTPSNGQVLKFDGTNWVNSAVTYTETDPTVQAYAKLALPTCGAGQVLKSNGTAFSCVADNTGAGAFTGTADRVVVTDGAGALSTSTVSTTVFNYLANVTSDIQTQLNTKANTSSLVNWGVAGVETLEPTRLNLTTADRVVVTNGTQTPVASTITTTQLGYLSGVTSNIQTQLNTKISSETDPNVTAFAKAALPTCGAGEVLKADGTTLTCVTDNAGAGSYTGTQNRLVLTDGTTGALTTSTVTNVEAGYLSGVTSNIQTQLSAKQNTLDKTSVQDFSKLRIFGANATNYVELSAQTLTANRILNFPDSNGASGNVLSTDGAGNLSWIAIPSAPVTSLFGRTGAVSATAGDYNASQVTNTAAGNIASTNVQTALNELDTEKEPLITNPNDTTKYYRGDKTWQTFASDVLSSVLSTFALDSGTKPVVNNSDTVVGAFGKVQKSINDINSDYVSKSADNNVTGSFNLTGIASFLQIPTPSGAVVNEAANVQYVQNYVATKGQWTKGTGGNINDIYFNTGNVGVGVVNPYNKFEVNGTTYSSASISGNWLAVGFGPGASQSNIDNRKFGVSGNNGTPYASTSAAAESPYVLGGGGGAIFSNNGSGDNTHATLEFSVLNGASNDQLIYMGAVATAGAGSYTPSFVIGHKTGATSYVERMRLDQNGNLGIGTTSPTDLLSIENNSNSYTTASVKNTSTGNSAAAYYQLSNSVNSGYLRLNGSNYSTTGYNESNTLTLSTGAGISGLNIATFSNVPIKFFTSATEKVRIDGAGNVGIGVATPAAKLDVNGDLAVNSSYESASAYVNSTTTYAIPDTQANIRRITLTGNATITLPAFTAPIGKMYTLTLFLKQDATGSRTVSFAGNGGDTILWDSNTTPTIASTAGKITIVQFTKASDETVWYASLVWKGE